MRRFGRDGCMVVLVAAAFSGNALADYGTDQTGFAATGRYDLIEQQLESMQAKAPLRTRDNMPYAWPMPSSNVTTVCCPAWTVFKPWWTKGIGAHASLVWTMPRRPFT